MRKIGYVITVIVLSLFGVGCTDDVIRTDQTDFVFLPATESEALSAGCSNLATARSMYVFTDFNNNGKMDTDLERETAAYRETLCGGNDGQDGRDGYNVLVATSPAKNCDGTFVAFYHDVNSNNVVDEEDNFLNGYNACNGIDGLDAYSLVANTSIEGGCAVVTLYLDLDYSGSVTEMDAPQSSFTICNGADGADGQDGRDGASAPLLLVEAFQIAPLSQELIFYLDLDGDFALSGVDIIVERVVVKDGEQGIQGIQGPQGERGEAGTPGADGTDGLDGVSPPALSIFTEEIEGTTYFTFYYDTNSNGSFDASDEIASTGSVTDGEDGIDGATGDAGAPGKDGEDGEDGYSWLFNSEIVTADPYCSAEMVITVPYAGNDDTTRITFIKWIETEAGIKAKWRLRNGQDVAVTNVSVGVGNDTPIYVATSVPANTEIFFITGGAYNGVSVKWNGGSKGTASSGNKPETAEAACRERGIFLFGGWDTNRNGNLEESEIYLTQGIPAGKDGEDGQDFTGTTIEYVDPLPNVAPAKGKHRELVMKETDAQGNKRYFGVYYDTNKDQVFLSELFAGTKYATTDGRYDGTMATAFDPATL